MDIQVQEHQIGGGLLLMVDDQLRQSLMFVAGQFPLPSDAMNVRAVGTDSLSQVADGFFQWAVATARADEFMKAGIGLGVGGGVLALGGIRGLSGYGQQFFCVFGPEAACGKAGGGRFKYRKHFKTFQD